MDISREIYSDNYDKILLEECSISDSGDCSSGDCGSCDITGSRDSEEPLTFGVDKDRFSNKEILYYKSINRYFRKECGKENVQEMVDIINKKSKISLRKLEWLIIKYARKNRRETTYEVNGEAFPLHISYEAQLGTFKKAGFDPFRRKKDKANKRFNYNYDKSDKSKYIETTIGQLNFFKWAFENKIIEFYKDNEEKLNSAFKDMKKAETIAKEKKINALKRKARKKAIKKKAVIPIKKDDDNVNVKLEINVDMI